VQTAAIEPGFGEMEALRVRSSHCKTLAPTNPTADLDLNVDVYEPVSATGDQRRPPGPGNLAAVPAFPSISAGELRPER
jgi:hypothetical protein